MNAAAAVSLTHSCRPCLVCVSIECVDVTSDLVDGISLCSLDEASCLILSMIRVCSEEKYPSGTLNGLCPCAGTCIIRFVFCLLMVIGLLCEMVIYVLNYYPVLCSCFIPVSQRRLLSCLLHGGMMPLAHLRLCPESRSFPHIAVPGNTSC